MKHAGLSQPMRAVGGRSVDTRGWDTVTAVRLDVMNEAISAAKTSPSGFADVANEDANVQAEFDDWEISPDSDGRVVTLQLPMWDIIVTEDGTKRTYERAYARVDVLLELLPHDALSTPDVLHCLLVTSLKPQPGSDKAAIVTEVVIDGDYQLIDTVYIQVALDRWLGKNLAAFTHVFATVNIHNQVTDQEDFRWLKPFRVGYSFGYNSEDPTQSIMAVLCRTDGRTEEGLPHQVEIEALPKNTTVSYLISKQRFVHDMLKGAVCRSFEGLKESDLKVDVYDTTVKLKHDVALKDVVYEGKTYDLTLEQLDLSIREVDFHVRSQTASKVFPGIWSICVATASYGFGLIHNKSGQLTLGFSETEAMETQKSQRVSAGMKVLEWMLIIVGAIAALVLSIVTFGVGSIIPTILAGILVGTGVGIVSLSIVKAVTEDNGPPIDLLLMNATSAVTWCAGRTFLPTVAGLNGAVQIAGHFEHGETSANRVSLERFQAPYAAFMEARVQ